MTASPFSRSPTAARHEPSTLPHWLADEAMLADEAVLFGLSEARPDERIAQIRLAFAERTVGLEKQIEQAQEQVGDINLALETAHARLNQSQPNLQSVGAGRLFSVAGQRFLVRLAVSGLGCIGAFWGTDALFPGTMAGLLAGGLLGLSGIGATLVRYGFDQKARLDQQRADRLLFDQQLTRLNTELGDYQRTKQQLIGDLYQAEAHRDGQYAHRDRLMRLFESEFDLARSLRYSLKPDDAPYV